MKRSTRTSAQCAPAFNTLAFNTHQRSTRAPASTGRLGGRTTRRQDDSATGRPGDRTTRRQDDPTAGRLPQYVNRFGSREGSRRPQGLVIEGHVLQQVREFPSRRTNQPTRWASPTMSGTSSGARRHRQVRVGLWVCPAPLPQASLLTYSRIRRWRYARRRPIARGHTGLPH
ncbi:hypothetical protein CF326_g3583 [Tilletia indica]|nr:hypothetical protein CF326_g3583 [Tilletia indica]